MSSYSPNNDVTFSRRNGDTCVLKQNQTELFPYTVLGYPAQHGSRRTDADRLTVSRPTSMTH